MDAEAGAEDDLRAVDAAGAGGDADGDGTMSPGWMSVADVRTQRLAFGEVDRVRTVAERTREAETVGALVSPPSTKVREDFPLGSMATDSDFVPSINMVTDPLIVSCPLMATGADEVPRAFATLTLP